MKLSELPKDMILNILKKMSVNELVSLGGVDRALRKQVLEFCQNRGAQNIMDFLTRIDNIDSSLTDLVIKGDWDLSIAEYWTAKISLMSNDDKPKFEKFLSNEDGVKLLKNKIIDIKIFNLVTMELIAGIINNADKILKLTDPEIIHRFFTHTLLTNIETSQEVSDYFNGTFFKMKLTETRQYSGVVLSSKGSASNRRFGTELSQTTQENIITELRKGLLDLGQFEVLDKKELNAIGNAKALALLSQRRITVKQLLDMSPSHIKVLLNSIHLDKMVKLINDEVITTKQCQQLPLFVWKDILSDKRGEYALKILSERLMTPEQMLRLDDSNQLYQFFTDEGYQALKTGSADVEEFLNDPRLVL